MTAAAQDEMSTRLYQCTSGPDQVAWTVAHFKAGGTISDVSLWLAGIDLPMRVLARAKSALRAEGLTVTGIMRNVADAAGQTHDILTWSVER
ncbi:MAG: hypothetical protein EON55_09265 [Alphaproteobacteria bacterium]|nr:MAG: hypothetical protein EON55_09265 [Alphaproteobacteria bacterium]